MYERAAAAHTGNTSFAMPYWDWTSLRDYPLAFTQKKYKDRLNPLYAPNLDDAPQARRRPLQGRNALNDSQVGQAVMEQVYAETVFEAFGTSRPTDRSVTPPLPQSDLHPRWATMGGGNQGVLERTPHNAVHNNIGGYMPTGASVRDPIFMVHHCNVDRIWARWNALGRENSADPLWLNMRFVDNFIDPWGRRYSATVKELLDIAALGYSYDDMPGPDGVKPDRQRSARFAALLDPASNIPRARAEGRTSAMPDQAWSANAPMDGDFTSALSAPQEQRSIVAVISDIVMGEGVPSIRVFVNRQTVGLEVPDTDPHFVTTLSFLAHAAGAHAHHGTHTAALPSTIVDLTPTLRRLAVQGKLLGDTITVQLLAVPDPDTQVRSSVDVKAGAIEIAVI
jgi:tyrosinase